MSIFLGIDVGGSGIKGAPVDLETGELVGERLRIPTPAKSTPANVAAVVKEIIEAFEPVIGDAPVGLTIPAPVVHGVVTFIANLDQKWAGVNADKFFEEKLGRKISLVNDADAAGLAEVHFGAAKGNDGLVILTTIHAQDFADIAGDSALGRVTFPIRAPALSRALIYLGIPLLSLALSVFLCDLSLLPSIPTVSLRAVGEKCGQEREVSRIGLWPRALRPQ